MSQTWQVGIKGQIISWRTVEADSLQEALEKAEGHIGTSTQNLGAMPMETWHVIKDTVEVSSSVIEKAVSQMTADDSDCSEEWEELLAEFRELSKDRAVDSSLSCTLHWDEGMDVDIEDIEPAGRLLFEELEEFTREVRIALLEYKADIQRFGEKVEQFAQDSGAEGGADEVWVLLSAAK
jgi:hypothetical protein